MAETMKIDPRIKYQIYIARGIVKGGDTIDFMNDIVLDFHDEREPTFWKFLC